MVALGLGAVVLALLLGGALGRYIGSRGVRTPAAEAAVAERARRRGRLTDRVITVSHHGVVVVDRDEFVVLVNPAARELGVVERDQLAVPQLVSLVRQVLATTATQADDTVTLDLEPGVRRDVAALSVVAAPIWLDGDTRPGAVALLLDDVTEARRLDAVRRDFVANVSHELKTPVGALTLLAEAVQEAANEPEVVARFAERMQREGARLGRLVRELIELSRLQGAEPLPGSDRIALIDAINDAVDRNRLAAEQAGIALLVRCDDDVVVGGNAAQLAMAVSNLLENAISYSPTGTRVGVTVQQYRAGGRAMVAVAVSDQGIGIAEVDRDRVFERFYRIDPARSRATGGTGLGLAIVKHVATNHGGSVTVWSREGSGSTFTMRLPRMDVGNEPPAPDPPVPDSHRPDPDEPTRLAGSTTRGVR